MKFKYTVHKAQIITNKNKKLKWDHDKILDYVNILSSDDVTSKFINVFESMDLSPTADDVDNMVTRFTDVLSTVAEPLFSVNVHSSYSRTAFNNCQPVWMTDECLRLRMEYSRCLDEFRYNNSDESRLQMVAARSLYTRHVRTCKRLYDREYTERLISKMGSNPKEFWKLLRPCKKSNSTNIKPNDFFDYFKRISNPGNIIYEADDDIYEYLRTYTEGHLDNKYTELNNCISEIEVKHAITELKGGKAAGADLLINELYICGQDILIPKLKCLFDAVFKSSFFPDIWKKGVIVPLYKKGSVNDVDNYRGITLLSTLGKLFTRILNNRLNFWSDTYTIISDSQSGFRKSRSTVDNIFILQSLVDSSLNSNNKLYVCFIDFKKAFDHVNRDCLWYKLIKSGVRGPIFNIIKNMYCDTTSRVRFNGELSDSFECKLGVRQGESLSPFLFNMFLNDIEVALHDGGFQGVNVGDVRLGSLLYADDLLLMASTRDDLQLGLDILHDYCSRWRLAINKEKTNIVIFRKGGQLSHDDNFFYGDSLLDINNSYTYFLYIFGC